jgi:uncharacterized protein YlaI
MTPEQIRGLTAASALAWVTLNNLVSENQRALEFKNHRFMIQVYGDNAHDMVCIKSAQIGFSTYAILKSFHELKFEQRNVLYALPTRNVVQDFVVPKVNPLISSNAIISKDMGSDSVSLKKMGERFIYFKGGSEREAISVSADTLVVDELDRMPDMAIVTMFDSRLQAAAEPRRRRFSNPSSIGYGVDALFQDSNQYHWFIKCLACNHEWFIDFEASDDKRHYINKDIAMYVCGNCQRGLTDDDRRNGRWVSKYPDRARHGYWFSQMMAPWVTARRIIDQSNEMPPEVFYSMVLGKAYTPSDMVVDRAAILRACVPSAIPRMNVAMGVDQKASELEWVAMTPMGVFAYGRAKSWEDIEHLKLTWNAVIVADAMPYTTGPKLLAERYSDFYMCYFKEMRGLEVTEFKGSVVYADRTRLLDIVAKEITEAKLLFRMRPQELEEYIADWANIYRTTVEEPNGRTKSEWLKKDNRESDLSFATAYARIALSQVLASGSFEQITATTTSNAPITDAVTDNGTLTTINQGIQDAFDMMD